MKTVYILVCALLLQTSFLSAKPKKAPEKSYLCLITGCARSGTGFISSLCNENGFAVGHEELKSLGLASWLMTVEAATAPFGPGRKNIRFKHIFHQVRHPLAVISSVYTTEPYESWKYITDHCSEISLNDYHIVKCAKYWYYWNKKADAIAEWTYRVEDIETVWGEFLSRLSLSSTKPLKMVSTKTNTRYHEFDISWEDLKRLLDPTLYQNIIQLAKQYGYDTPSN